MDRFIIEILENIPEMFDIGPNDYDQVEKLQLLIKNDARIDKERSKQCFKSYTCFARYPKNYITVLRLVKERLYIARISDRDFIIKHGTSNNLFRFKDYNLPLLLKALRLPRTCKFERYFVSSSFWQPKISLSLTFFLLRIDYL